MKKNKLNEFDEGIMDEMLHDLNVRLASGTTWEERHQRFATILKKHIEKR